MSARASVAYITKILDRHRYKYNLYQRQRFLISVLAFAGREQQISLVEDLPLMEVHAGGVNAQSSNH